MTTDSGSVDDVLVALADPMRRRVLDVLASYGEATATTISTGLPVSRQAVAKHLEVLDRAGLVVGQRRGREVRYRIRSQPLDITARWMAGLAAEWNARLHAIKRVAESAPTSQGGPDQGEHG